MGTAIIKHPVPYRVKSLFVIFDAWPECQKLPITA